MGRDVTILTAPDYDIAVIERNAFPLHGSDLSSTQQLMHQRSPGNFARRMLYDPRSHD